MKYIILTQDYEGGDWRRQDAGDKGAAKRLLLQEIQDGKKPVLAVEVPFKLELKVGDGADLVKKVEKDEEPPEPEKQEEEPDVETNENPSE